MSAIDLILRYGRQGVPPTFQRDFAGVKTLDHGTGPAITFTRASNATFFDANGTLQTAANDTPRFDHDPASAGNPSRGLLIEEARTNSIRNSQAGGATVGVIGSGGVVPTNWTMSTPDGIAREVVATGTINGMNYVDLRWNGTRSGGSVGSIQIVPEALTAVAASIGQTWSGTMRIAVVSGSFTGTTSPIFTIQERTSGGSFLTGTAISYTASSSLTQLNATRTLTGATAERVTLAFGASVADGATVDITLRIAAPQLEQGAFPTSYIPTTTAAATRAADSAVVTPISSFYNQAEGTLFAEAERSFAVPSEQFPRLIDISDGTLNNRFAIGYSMATQSAMAVIAGETTQASMVVNNSAVLRRVVGAAKANDFAMSANGSSVATDTSGDMPSVSVMRFTGDAGGSFRLNGHLRKVAYYPRRLSNTLLQQLTT
jgi:hypothetical protein